MKNGRKKRLKQRNNTEPIFFFRSSANGCIKWHTIFRMGFREYKLIHGKQLRNTFTAATTGFNGKVSFVPWPVFDESFSFALADNEVERDL